jgi:hypothetical protein
VYVYCFVKTPAALLTGTHAHALYRHLRFRCCRYLQAAPATIVKVFMLPQLLRTPLDAKPPAISYTSLPVLTARACATWILLVWYMYYKG